MKKTLVTLIMAGLVSGVASAATVGSANVVGYAKTDIAAGGTFYMMTCNFKTDATNTLLSVFGTDMLTQDDSYLNSDRVFLYDSSNQTYQAYAQWTDGVFYKANNLPEWNTGTAGNPVLLPGTGFFVSSGNVSNKLVFSGEVITAATQNVAIVEGYQIKGIPFSSAVNIQDTGFFASGAAADDNYANCDRLYVWNGSGYQAYAVWTDGVWYKANNLDEWALGTAATDALDLNEGFFYEAQTNMTWSETNNYINNL
jgi:hypothetical protein